MSRLTGSPRAPSLSVQGAGLPPLPKSLSGLLNSSGGGSWREMERLYAKKSMIQDELSRLGRSGTNGGGSGLRGTDPLRTVNKPANLDAALALLRKEMIDTFMKHYFRCPVTHLSHSPFWLGFVSWTCLCCASYGLCMSPFRITKEPVRI
ncbi:protein FAM89A isoform X2 [Protopterus annectens]|uniref:protein FAM89A isoform X2 n=1 Tax=Protopterus annectens TaxID=7888 RepID=UPI001CFB09B2|nr:protein FAM89A isoform X2 [Protopterus annectens]